MQVYLPLGRCGIRGRRKASVARRIGQIGFRSRRRLQGVQKIDRALRVGGGGEDQALVVVEGLEPGGDISGVILPHLRSQSQIGAQKGATQLSHQFFFGITGIAPLLAA